MRSRPSPRSRPSRSSTSATTTASSCPLAEASDTLATPPAANPTFPHRRLGVPEAVVRSLPGARGHDGSITVAAGDSVGATPPITCVLRRHADDRAHESHGLRSRWPRQPQLRQGVGVFPRTRSSRSRTSSSCPPTWSSRPPARRRRSGQAVGSSSFDGIKVGIIGFTNDDAPTLVFPGCRSTRSCHELRPTPSTSQGGAARRQQKHGPRSSPWATSARPPGTLTAPTGPAVALADAAHEGRCRHRRPHGYPGPAAGDRTGRL